MITETAGSIAELVGGAIHGDPNRPITGVADFRHAGPQQLGFVHDPRLEASARSTRAAALLVRRVLETDAVQIVVANVYAAFARAAQRFHPLPRAEQHFVHPTAVVAADARLHAPVHVGPHATVGAGAEVGAGTMLGAGVVVGASCRIGKACVLYPRVVLYDNVQLGDRVILHSGVVIGADGYGYARDDNGTYVKFPQVGTVVLEDDVEIGANTTIDRAALGRTRIGRGSKIDNLCQVGHNCDIGEDVAVAGFSAFSGSTVLGDRVMVGGHVVSSGHNKVAADAKIGGNSVIYYDVAPGAELVGYPLQEKRQWMRTLRALDRVLELQDEVKRLAKQLDGMGA